MRIAQIAPLYECVPPKRYGGTERIVSFLTEELVRQGHEVTLFASGDSRTSATLVPCYETALRLNPEVRDALPYHMIMLEKVRRRIDQFDILHFHIDVLHAPLVHGLADRTLTTLHGRLDLPDLGPFYATFLDLPLALISNSQQQHLKNANWLGTVYHGLPRHLLAYRRNADGYLAFLGRIAPEKRPDRAIEIARRSGLPLKMAAKVDRADQAYWQTKILPMIMAHPQVEFLGEIGESDKVRLLGDTIALLFPIDWPEPFGRVMVEAMACGTPVIAYRRGSVPEIIQDGVSGFIAETIEEAVAAVQRAADLDRAKVRAEFERRFTAERMARDYLGFYQQLRSVRTRPQQPRSNRGRKQWKTVQPLQPLKLINDLQVSKSSCVLHPPGEKRPTGSSLRSAAQNTLAAAKPPTQARK
jgi:glycosyltransferase involved in cell wall biosynthesis